ncbi:hypothetical protein DFJ74DRAFT_764948 [Hyaloraphidium curvatum]|nr:hypothetical protein DFJ74DRAFT_764948 [Hyaloraphidium curvatum]
MFRGAPHHVSIHDLSAASALLSAPFVRPDAPFRSLPLWDKSKAAAACVILLPPRILLLLFAVFSAWTTASLASLGLPSDDPAPGPPALWRRALLSLLAWHARLALLSMGVWWIRIDDRRPPGRTGRPGIVVANHTSILDVLVLMYACDALPSFVAREGIAKVPLIGTVARAMRCIPVGPSSPDALPVISSRAHGTGPPLVTFPEGTTTNGTAILPFRRGAFLPLCPVQPVLLRYPWKRYSPSWETKSPGEWWFRLATQWSVGCRVVWLEPMEPPGEGEGTDAERAAGFARAAQTRFAEELGVPVEPSSRRLKAHYHAFIMDRGKALEEAVREAEGIWAEEGGKLAFGAEADGVESETGRAGATGANGTAS